MAEEETLPTEKIRKPLGESQIRTAIMGVFDQVISGEKISAKLLKAVPRDGYTDVAGYDLFGRGEGDIILSLKVLQEEINKRGFNKANYKITRAQEFPEGTHGIFPEVGLLRHEEGVTTSEAHPEVIIYSEVWRDQDRKHVLLSEWEAVNNKALGERTPDELKKIIDEGLIGIAIALEEAGVPTRFPSVKVLKEMLRRIKKKKK